jgi:hypothetical protein
MTLYFGSEESKYSFSAGLFVGCVFGASVSAHWILTGRSDCKTVAKIEEDISDASDSKDFLAAGKNILDIIVDYRENLVNALPVISKVSPNYLMEQLPSEAPTADEPWSRIYGDIHRLIIPGLTNWESNSKFFAYFKPHSSYPAVLGMHTNNLGLQTDSHDYFQANCYVLV